MKRYSIRYQLLLGIGVFVAVLLLCMSLGNAYAIGLVRNQVYESNKNTIYLYLEQAERGLEDAEGYLFNVSMYNLELKTMSISPDQGKRLLASYELNHYFQRNLQLYPGIEAFFAYSPKDGQYVYSEKQVKSWQEQEALKECIVNAAENAKENGRIPSGWTAEKIGEKYYFFKYSNVGQTVIGTWVSAEVLLENLTTIDVPGFTHILFLDDEGNPLSEEPFLEEEGIGFDKEFSGYYLTGSRNKYLVIGEKSEKLGVQLTMLLRDTEILEGLGTLRRLIFLLIVAAGLGGVWLLWFMRRTILRPLENLVDAMTAVRQERLDVRLEEGNKSEFGLVNSTFNVMTEEIRSLKIGIYEEKIQKQKAQLDFYALQVNPHFLINSMNTIYNFARMGEMKMIQEFISCIVEHFRYTLYGDGKVLLEDEVKFTQNYLRMQQLRSFNRTNFELKIWMEEGMEKITVPNLLLQGFVENSVKHTKAEQGLVLVEIQAFLEETQEGNYVNVRVQDSGSGFEPEVLQKLNAGEKLEDERGKHIGIYNIRQRLYLLYGDRVEVRIENRRPHGATVSVRFFQPAEK